MNIVLTLSEATIERETSHVNFVGSDPQSCAGSLLCQLVVFIPDVLSVLVSIYVMVLSAPLCIGTARGADLSGENLNNNI